MYLQHGKQKIIHKIYNVPAGDNVQRKVTWRRGIRSKGITVLNKVFRVDFTGMVT